MTDHEAMRDAAFASNIPADWTGAVAGYYGGPDAYHVWSRADWLRFTGNQKLPIWVGGRDGTGEAFAALHALWLLGVPSGVWTCLDMETRTDRTYVAAFGGVLRWAGFRVWVYGSASSVFGNPALDGYWVADYAGTGPFMYSKPGVEIRATQYASGAQFDSSTVKPYTLAQTDWWV